MDNGSKIQSNKPEKLLEALEAGVLATKIDRVLGLTVFQLDWIPSAVLGQKTNAEHVQERIDSAKDHMQYAIFSICTGGMPWPLALDIAKPYKTEREEVLDYQLASRLVTVLTRDDLPGKKPLDAMTQAIKKSDLDKQLKELNQKAITLVKAIDDTFDEIRQMMAKGPHRMRYEEYQTREQLILAGAAVFILAAHIGIFFAEVATDAALGEQSFAQLTEILAALKRPDDTTVLSVFSEIALAMLMSTPTVDPKQAAQPSRELLAGAMVELLGAAVTKKAMEQGSDQDAMQVVNDGAAVVLSNIGEMEKVAVQMEKHFR